MNKKWLLSICFLFLSTAVMTLFAEPPSSKEPAVSYQAKDYSSLLGMPGFSQKALQTHFKLYQGYVSNANLLQKMLKELAQTGKNRSPEYAELKRRFGWEFDGMRLHEYYFENLKGPSTLDPSSFLYTQIVADFGSYEAWKADFIATGSMRGIGWAVLYLDPASGHLFNVWINEHDLGHLAGGKPILIMDVFEHAYMIDYTLDRAAYIEAFFKNINWDIALKRFGS